MKQSVCVALLLLVCGITSAAAQDLVITNVRVIVGNDTVIDRGTVVVRGGRIASVSAGQQTPAVPAAQAPVQMIDARGGTAVPGFIDAHRHVNTGPDEKAQMQALLDAGYTTVLSGGGPAEGNITLRDHIDRGAIK